jgi:lipoate-protein ligase B
LVGYPVVHLGDAGLSVLGYVEAIETVLIRTAAGFGVTARRDARNRGVWVGNDKLAALGIRVSRQVASHGFAFNVAPRLDHYRGIVACGLKGAGVTSLAAILGRPPDMTEVRRTVVAAFCDVLGYESPAV